MPGSKQQPEIDQRSMPAEHVPNSVQPRELAAYAAHELRGPINTLQAFLSILLREQPGPLNEIQRDFVSSMYVISRRLERFADDIQIMMAEGKGLTIESRRADLLSLVNECVREVTPTADNFNVQIDVIASQDAHWDALIDPVRFSQIAINLIENAARNEVEAGTVTVTLKHSISRILLVVENEAVDKVPEGIVEDWFAPLVRGATSSQRAPGGAGLGLSVVSHLVSALGGQIVARARGQQVSIGVQLPRAGRSEVTIDCIFPECKQRASCGKTDYSGWRN
jgi:signal transduction histidine kinase